MSSVETLLLNLGWLKCGVRMAENGSDGHILICGRHFWEEIWKVCEDDILLLIFACVCGKILTAQNVHHGKLLWDRRKIYYG